MVAKKATKKKVVRKSPAARKVTSKKTVSKKAITITKSMPIADIRAQLQKEADDITNRIGGAAGPKISITRNKNFRFPDGREAPQIGVVIVDFRTIHLYYDKPYREGDVNPPVCYAVGTNPRDMYPSPNGTDIQAENCQECPMNQFGSSGAGKACQNRRLLAVVPPTADPEEDMLTLSVSPTGLKRYDSYVGQVKAEFGMPPIAVVTQVSFDQNSDYSTLIFGGAVPNENLQAHFARKQEAEALLTAEPS